MPHDGSRQCPNSSAGSGDPAHKGVGRLPSRGGICGALRGRVNPSPGFRFLPDYEKANAGLSIRCGYESVSREHEGNTRKKVKPVRNKLSKDGSEIQGTQNGTRNTLPIRHQSSNTSGSNSTADEMPGFTRNAADRHCNDQFYQQQHR